MSAEENKVLVQQMLRLMENGDLNTVDQVIARNWDNHDGSLQGYEGFKQLSMLFRSAFPGFHDEIEDLLAESDKVAARWRFHGTNSGSFQGMPPTGKAIDVTATGIFRVVDGKVTDNWVSFDMLGLLQQLGVIPSMG
jgi:steroid delta-isomerase-like uncharacterized protein